MKDDDSRHNTEEGSSHNAAASFAPHDQGEETSKVVQLVNEICMHVVCSYMI